MTPNRKIIIGIFLAGGLLLFAFGLFLIGDRRMLLSDSIELYTEFHNLSGLKNGAPVRVSGMDAGEIEEISVPGGPESKFRVKFRALAKFRPILRTNSVATIQTDGLVGNKILSIGLGSPDAPPAEPGAILPSREPFEFSDLLEQANEGVRNANEAVTEIREGVNDSVQTLSEMGTEATALIRDVGGQIERITVSGTKISEQASALLDEVQAGKGTIGKLFKDDQMYQSVRETVDEVEMTVNNLKQTSDDLNEIISSLRSGGMVESFEKVAQNVQEVTAQAKEVLEQLKPKEDGGRGLTADLRETIANTRDATADLAENMEAMKRNWLFRGFFQNRGFYDAKDLSVEEYQSGGFAPNHTRRRKWLHESELFFRAPGGGEALSEEGKKKLDEAMVDFLPHVPSMLIVVEGYSSQGSEVEQALHSRERSLLVREYLIERFGLKPNYVGAMAMGAVSSSGKDGKPWQGVAIVGFLERKQAELKTDPRMLVPQAAGWGPRIGGLPPDSGFTLGAESWRNFSWGTLDMGVLALASVKKYEHGEFYLGLPRLANGRMFLAFNTRYRNYPEDNFWGIGPDSIEADRSDFRLEDVNYSGSFGFRPTRGMRVGVTGGLLYVNTGPGQDRRDPSIEEIFGPGQVPGLELQPDFRHLGAFVEYDSRDSPLNSRSGGLYQFRWTRYDDRDLDLFSFGRYDAEMRHFFPVRFRRDVIALRGVVSLSDVKADQRVPFFLQPTLGGGMDVRGLRQYRFRDNNALALNLEYRRELNPFLDVVFFGDAGKVFSETSQIALNNLEESAGIGGRIKLRESVFFGVDLGWSREGMRLWLRGTHAF